MWIYLVAFIILISTGIFTYNGILKRKFLVKEASAGIDVQLKRRHDLIPRLVDLTKGYMRYEQGVLKDIVELRNKAQGTQSMNEKASLETGISQSLKTIIALVENYPDLKAGNNFIELHKALVDTEDQLQMARRYYNGAVRDYNIAIESFPGVVIASIFIFKPADFFEIEYATIASVPKVDLEKNSA